MALSKKMLIIGSLVILLIVVVSVVLATVSNSSSSSSVKVNGKSVELTTAPAITSTKAPTTMAPTTQAPTTRAPTTMAPTTMAPTTMAPTTMAPTTMAPTTMAPTTMAPTTMAPIDRNVKVLSLERYDNEYINLAEILIYNEQGTKINPSDLKAIQSPGFQVNAYPANNLVNNNESDFAHTDKDIVVQNPENYEMFGDYIPGVFPVQHIAYLSSIGKSVAMINDGGFLKMVTIGDTQQRFIANGNATHPALLFDESKWNTEYNKITDRTTAYQVRLKSGPTKVPNKIQYMQLVFNTPTKLSKVEIVNRTDCCQERINGLVVRTINKSGFELSNVMITGGGSSRIVLTYLPQLGLVRNMSRSEQFTSYRNPNWRQINTPATPIAVSMDGNVSAMASAVGKIFYSLDFNTWKEVNSPSAGLKDMVINNGKMYVTTSNDSIFMCEKYYEQGSPLVWKQLNGALAKISVDGDIISGVTSTGEIYYAIGPNGTNTPWILLPAPAGKKCVHISVKNGMVITCAFDGSIYYGGEISTPSWRQIQGGLKEAFTNGAGKAYGINVQTNVYYLEDVNTSNWTPVPGGLKRLAVSEGRMFCIGTDDKLYVANN